MARLSAPANGGQVAADEEKFLDRSLTRSYVIKERNGRVSLRKDQNYLVEVVLWLLPIGLTRTGANRSERRFHLLANGFAVAQFGSLGIWLAQPESE